MTGYKKQETGAANGKQTQEARPRNTQQTTERQTERQTKGRPKGNQDQEATTSRSQPKGSLAVGSFAAPSSGDVSRRAPLIESSAHLILGLDPATDVLSLTLPSSARDAYRPVCLFLSFCYLF